MELGRIINADGVGPWIAATVWATAQHGDFVQTEASMDRNDPTRLAVMPIDWREDLRRGGLELADAAVWLESSAFGTLPSSDDARRVLRRLLEEAKEAEGRLADV